MWQEVWNYPANDAAHGWQREDAQQSPVGRLLRALPLLIGAPTLS